MNLLKCLRLLCPFVALTVFLSCGSHTDKLQSTSTALSSPTPTYAWLRENLFMQKCIGCHWTGRPTHGINLSNYESTMGSPNAVVAGNPQASHIFTQIRDHMMPPPSKPPAPPTVPVSDVMIQMVEQWIQNGAKPQ
jgi:hypothetical protein